MSSSELDWLVYLCIQEKLVDENLAQHILEALGEDADVLMFAETILANDLCQDENLLQQLIDTAWQYAQSGHEVPGAQVTSSPAQAQPSVQEAANTFNEDTEEVIPVELREEITRAQQIRPRMISEREAHLSAHVSSAQPQPSPAEVEQSEPQGALPAGKDESQKTLRPVARLKQSPPSAASPG
ncbi:MAG: hypothetical protein D6820_02055, partial [Lentisphaerae bacterium]